MGMARIMCSADLIEPVPLFQTPVVTLTDANGKPEVLYSAWPKQLQYHATTTPKFLLEGERGTGKSTVMRWDAHLKAISYPGYKYLMLRRTMPELRKSHLLYIGREMEKLGGDFLKTYNIAQYSNGSVGLFGHCETEQDIAKYLSADFHLIIFDEIVTFDWDMITRISPSCRVPKGSGLIAMIRGGTNPLGESADEVHRYFIARDVTRDEDPHYDALDWGSLHMTMDDNPSLDKEQYLKQFSGLPEAYRKAWLEGEWGVEGAYFSLRPEHEIKAMPRVDTAEGSRSALQWPWIHVYRVFDWGWHDPSVCVWIAVLPNGREIPFKEMSWVRTPAQQVAQEMLEASADMRVVTTIADPTLWDGEKEMGHCLADEMERVGVPLTRGKNDRTACGFAIQEHLNQLLPDGNPKLQMFEPGCPMLLKALRAMRIDKKHKGRIADHKWDHMPIALGYFCMAGVGPTQVPVQYATKPWMRHRETNRHVLGADGVRRRIS